MCLQLLFELTIPYIFPFHGDVIKEGIPYLSFFLSRWSPEEMSQERRTFLNPSPYRILATEQQACSSTSRAQTNSDLQVPLTLSALPPEVLEKIFGYLGHNVTSLRSVAGVCLHFHQIACKVSWREEFHYWPRCPGWCHRKHPSEWRGSLLAAQIPGLRQPTQQLWDLRFCRRSDPGPQPWQL